MASTELEERLNKIRSPKLQNQRETAVVLSAVNETLTTQNPSSAPTPTAYFAALLALLNQCVSTPTTGPSVIVNKSLATSVVYLLDLVAPHVPPALLRGKFSTILHALVPVLVSSDIEAPLMRSSIGCLETLLLAQDGPAWSVSVADMSARRAMGGLVVLAKDHRPKVRKRALDAVAQILGRPPPSPAVDHPAAEMCAESAIRELDGLGTLLADQTKKGKKGGKESGADGGSAPQQQQQHQPGMIHALQLIKTVATASSGGWPAKKLEVLCEVLMRVSRTSNEWLTMTAYEIFEVIFAGMASEITGVKLPRLIQVIEELRPGENDERLLPPWIAVLSRGYDVSSQVEPMETFQKLPLIFDTVAAFLVSSSHNIRVSASECLISFLVNCIPASVILEPSIYDEKVLEKIAKTVTDLLSVKYQAAWMEVFNVLTAIFRAYKWRGAGLLDAVVKIVGGLREREAFTGKKETDGVIGEAVEAMGPSAVLDILPLNLSKPKAGEPGRAWLLPILRDHVQNTNLAHFRAELVPLSEVMFQRVMDHASAEKTMEIKIFETLVRQIWAILPGYCTLALDVPTAFDQTFAEMLATLLYKQIELRTDVCKALQLLVETNQAVVTSEATDDELRLNHQMTKAGAQASLDHLSTFAGNLLAVLFNVYSQTLPQHRGNILQCINAYLSITPEKELLETFQRVISMLETALTQFTSQTQADKQQQQHSKQAGGAKMPPDTHTLMDLLITLSIYLPRSTFPNLFALAAQILPLSADPQLQKKAYKLLPRLATCSTGVAALQERNTELQSLLLGSTTSVSAPARRDRLAAIAVVLEHLPSTDLYFIPAVLSEVVIACKEVNEKARSAAFDLLVAMAKKMSAGGQIDQTRIPHMDASAPTARASLEEFFTMVSAGLVGSTPHMISATITALTRILYEYVKELSIPVIEDLVQTMDLFLTSANREIVRSVLGFVKVAIISLPDEIVRPKLPTLIPGLMSWSKEHKAHFRSKVKHILERAIRRFGADVVERYCPEDDKKLVANIRKTRERRKRKNAASGENGAGDGDDDGDSEGDSSDAGGVGAAKEQRRFENEYDDALYGSESDDSDTQPRGAANGTKSSKRKQSKGDETYITEPSAADEPLDLLDARSLANISSRKPLQIKSTKKHRGKLNQDGKLILDDDDDDAMSLDHDLAEINTEESAGGVDAYISAIAGPDAVQRGRGGRLKFARGKPRRDALDNDNDDDDEGTEGPKSVRFAGTGGPSKNMNKSGVKVLNKAKGLRITASSPRSRGTGDRSVGGRGRGRGGIAKNVNRRPLGGRDLAIGFESRGGRGGGRGRGRGRGGR